MNSPLISVIIPIYKVENYIEKCLRSLLAQSYRNLEIIAVDDGSPDHSGEICDRIAAEDSRIHVIHKKNGGVSSARNAGLDYSHADYISFVDPDDYIAPNMIQRLFDVMDEKQADICVCDYKKVMDDTPVKFDAISNDQNIVEITEENKVEYFLGKTIVAFSVVWNKLYKKSVIQNVRFPEGKIHEDEDFCYRVLHNANRIFYIKEKLYYYLQRTDGIMGSEGPIDTLKRLDAFSERTLYYLERNMYDFFFQLFKSYRYYVVHFYQTTRDYKSIKPYFDFYRKAVFENIGKVDVNRKAKLECILFACFPRLISSMKKY